MISPGVFFNPMHSADEPKQQITTVIWNVGKRAIKPIYPH